jgi:hypothetical protein
MFDQAERSVPMPFAGPAGDAGPRVGQPPQRPVVGATPEGQVSVAAPPVDLFGVVVDERSRPRRSVRRGGHDSAARRSRAWP